MDPLDPRSGEQPSKSEGTAPWTPGSGALDPFGEPAVGDEPPLPAVPAADGDASRSAPADQSGDSGGHAMSAPRSGAPEPSPHEQLSTADDLHDLVVEEAPSSGRTKRAMQVIAALAVAAAALLVLGLWKPGFLNTTKLDLTIAQRDIEQLLSDRANGYGLTAVADVKCNNGENPTVRPGTTFTCTVSIGGSPRHVTVTFDNSAGDYTVSLPQ